MTVKIQPSPESVLDFWFGEIEDEMPVEPRLKTWFGGGKALDDEIRDKFESTVRDADAGKLDDWEKSAKGTLALIILLDQFPLNMYRKSARAFSFEPRAIAVCKSGLEKGFDKMLSLSERSFFYMPLEHSEDRQDQDLSLALFEQLHQDAPGRHREFTARTLEYAVDHRQTIIDFGRYPYRNAVLGRSSSSEELAYLENDGNRYGQ